MARRAHCNMVGAMQYLGGACEGNGINGSLLKQLNLNMRCLRVRTFPRHIGRHTDWVGSRLLQSIEKPRHHRGLHQAACQIIQCRAPSAAERSLAVHS